MRRLQWYVRMAVSLLLASCITVVAPQVSMAQTGCLPDVGKRLPVVLVHGLGGNISVWGDSKDPRTVFGRLNQNKEVRVGVFDYKGESFNWVDNPNIGPALAQDIACRAASSRQAGGSGKVVVITHSMGGLAARYAANQRVNNRLVADDLGLAINIATPHEGSMVASSVMAVVRDMCNMQSAFGIPVNQQACRDYAEGLGAVGALQAGSAKLKQLPKMPDSVPVLS